MQIGRGIWVVSPELLFLEASETLNRIDLIRLGMELSRSITRPTQTIVAGSNCGTIPSPARRK